MRGVQLGRGVGERMRHGLVVRDRLAERLALLGVFDRALERPAAETDGAGGVVDAAERYAIDGDPEAFIELADQLPRLDLDVLEHERALIAAGVAEQSHDALDRESGSAGRHEKGADASRLAFGLLRVGDGEDDAPFGRRAVGGPEFSPRDAPAGVGADGAGLD